MIEQEKTKILVVDDSQEVREKLSSVLKDMPEIELLEE